jgi:hypothetical protein
MQYRHHAGESEPGDGNAVAESGVCDAPTELLHDADPFMSWHVGSVGVTGQSPWAAWMSVWRYPHRLWHHSTGPSPKSGNLAVREWFTGMW